MNQPVRWGIIGLGKIAHKFAQDLSACPSGSLQAVGSRSTDKAKAFGAHYNATRQYNDYEQVLADPDVEAVYIATPHHEHARLAIAALQAGKAVLVEKPWAMNLREAMEIEAAAVRYNGLVMEAIWTRFLPTTLKILGLINEGVIGSIEAIKADFGFRSHYDPHGRLFDPKLGGGALLDIGIYPVFLSNLFLGSPQVVKAASRFSPEGCDLDTGMILQYANGVTAHLHCTLLAQTRTEAFIYGTEATIHWHSRWHEPSHFSILRQGQSPENHFFEYPTNGYSFEIEAMNEYVRAGLKASPLLPPSFSVELTRTLDRIRAEAGIVYPADGIY